ncbi:NYN domain-containing protein [Ilumatobacter sp.]|uniref:NYN domain-containing protein n=1 Tax=Ilumatobacter sp. TaxID=1967498 RepID=UPI003C621F68
MTTIEHRDLRSALEFVVIIAGESQKRRSPLVFPKDLKPFLGRPRVPSSSLGRIRRVVEADPEFRAAVSKIAVEDLVDDVGMLWLSGRAGWETEAAAVIAERGQEAATSDLRRDLKRAEKRRIAAEQATARIQVESMQHEARLAEQATELDDLRADLAKAREALDEVRAELIDTRNEARHARDREAAAVERAEVLASSIESGAAVAGSSVAADGAEPAVPQSDIDPDALISAEHRLAEMAAASREFVARIEALVVAETPVRPDEHRVRSPRRTLPLPGGLISTSAAAARHLIDQGAPILVDGYNVAKLAWPDRSLEQQRDALIARCENLARRHAATVVVVFDGDSVPGAHAPRRKMIRVVYSPAGTTADDVIRSEVGHLPDESPVIVVTNDREIVRDVKSAGANVVASNAFIAAF